MSAPHETLVPFDGTFDIAAAPTAPAGDGPPAGTLKNKLAKTCKAIGRQQQKLYADGRYALLLVFQAMDAAGKDGTIRHVFSGTDPVGLRVTSFKEPTATELGHDFLHRIVAQLPPRGSVGVFNRSHYEDVLAVRVHPQLALARRLPAPLPAGFWQDRYRAIVELERHLSSSGTVILKFWLNVSKDEQRRRFLARIDRPRKRWKFSERDLEERGHWDAYMAAYQDCLNATSRPWAPWHAIPADDKPYMRWQVATLIRTALAELDLRFPEPGPEAAARLLAAKRRLEQSGR